MHSLDVVANVIILVVFAATVLLTWWRAGWSWSIVVVAAAGVLQNPLLTWTHRDVVRWLDDVGLGVLSIIGLIAAVRSKHRIWLIVPALLAGITLIQALRGPDTDSAILQARQFLTPLLLLSIGAFMFPMIDRELLYRAAAVFALAISVYMLIEVATQSVIVDPTYSYFTEVTGRTPDDLRNGLPPAYTADITETFAWFRSGGPFFNAPIAGIFVASGIYGAMRSSVAWLKPATAVIGTLAIIGSIARAGLLLAVVVTLGYISWKYCGRLVTAIGGLAASVVAWIFFSGQGATASHATGLVSGLLIAFSRPWGDGLGAHGYFAPEDDTGSSESLLGLLFASVGIIAVLVTVILITALVAYLVRQERAQALPGIFLVGVLGICAFSESVTSLRGSVLLWVLAGMAIFEVASFLRAQLRPDREAETTAPSGSER